MRHVVVTGGSTGIGKAIAAAFIKEGNEVVITGRRPHPLAAAVAELGSAARAVRFDAADPAEVEEALAELPSSVDVLVNNAGGNTDLGQADPETLTDVARAWQANLDANLLSAVLVTTALRDRLTPGGAVINLSSIGAHRGRAGSSAAAKAGIEAWTTHTLAAELGADRITANVVAPGYIGSTEFFRGSLTDERRQWLIGETANKRAGTPEDIAATVLFLASPGASHITGQTIHVNGGALSS